VVQYLSTWHEEAAADGGDFSERTGELGRGPQQTQLGSEALRRSLLAIQKMSGHDHPLLSKNVIFKDVAPCGLVKRYRRFGGTCCLDLLILLRKMPDSTSNWATTTSFHILSSSLPIILSSMLLIKPTINKQLERLSRYSVGLHA
jgi:hypothetical protein